MNIVTIKQDTLFKYLDDKKFILNAYEQSKDYLLRYIRTGEVAFKSFGVQTEHESYKTWYCVNKYGDNPNDPSVRYSILVTFAYPLDSSLSKFDTAILNYTYYERSNGDIDGFIDVPTDGDFADTNDTLIKTYGADWRQWPFPIKRRAAELQMPLTLIFLKVQMSALKTSRKIQKATRRAQSKPMKFQPLDTPQTPNVIRLDEKMTLTIDISDGADSKREFIRHCEAWMVRGHYRHYKSGKVVYISPYKKGKEKLNDKIYEATKE
jgi:hypothetical protein